MLWGKLSVDLCVRSDDWGSDDCGGATLRVKPEDVQLAVQAAIIALDQMKEDVIRMVEVVKISWSERGKTHCPKTLVLRFEVIMVEPALAGHDPTGRKEPEKFRAFMTKEVKDVLDYERLAVLLAMHVEAAITVRGDHHASLSEVLKALAALIRVPTEE